MSELSQSLHLRCTDAAEAVAILSAAAVRGVVMPPSPRWVTILPELGFDDVRLMRIVAAPRSSLLLHWNYAEDHGLLVAAYEGADVVARIDVSWETRGRPRFDRASFLERGLITPEGADAIHAWSYRRTADYVAAVALELKHYSWARFDSAERAFEDGQLPGALFVDGDAVRHGSNPDETVGDTSAAPLGPTPWDALAAAVLEIWSESQLVAIEEPSEALLDDLADLLATSPSELAIEEFALEHAGIDEVYGDAHALAGAVTLAARGVEAVTRSR